MKVELVGQGFRCEGEPISDWIDEDAVTEEVQSEWVNSIEGQWAILECKERYVEAKISEMGDEALKNHAYKDDWIELKEEIVKLQKDYKNGEMMSLEESIQGNRTCELILRTMNDIETASDSVVNGKCKYNVRSRAYRACALCDSKNICKYIDDEKTAAEKLDDWQHARHA